MSTDTEARKAMVERAIELIKEVIGGLGDSRSVLLWAYDRSHNVSRAPAVADFRALIAAARAGIAGEVEEEAKAPACIFCGGECKIEGHEYRYVGCQNNACGTAGPNAPTPKAAVEAFLHPTHLPGASKPEPPPSEVAIVRGAISIVADRAGKAWVSASIPECESPAFSKLATADQLDALAALASRVAAEVRAKGVGR